MPPKKGGKPPVKTPEELEEEARLLQEEEDARLEAIRLQEEAEKESLRLAEIQRKLEENIKRVYFTKAKVKYICSSHSGSILANDGPVVPLPKDLEDKSRKIFNKFIDNSENNDMIETRIVPREFLVKILNELEYNCEDKYLIPAIDSLILQLADENRKHYKNENNIDIVEDGYESFNEDQFCYFLGRFQNPAQQYGQRLRRNVDRDQKQEVINIIARGCNVNTADGEGCSSLHYASEFNRVNLIKIMYKVSNKTLMIDPKDKYGWTPLYNACHHGNLDVVELLLNLNANLFATNSVGKTPLHAAASQNRLEICTLLLDTGGEELLSIQDNNGMTPLHEVAYKGHFDLYTYLSERMTKFITSDFSGFSGKTENNDDESENKVNNDDANKENMEEEEVFIPLSRTKKASVDVIDGHTLYDKLNRLPKDYLGNYSNNQLPSPPRP